MHNPINPRLYEILSQTFGQVQIQSPGSRYRYRVEYRRSKNSNIPTPLVHKFAGGEEYCVCCPKCGDTRFRLNVNHMFGARLPCGVKLTDVAHCWNENCEVLPMLQQLVEDPGFAIDIEAEQLTRQPTMEEIAEVSAIEHKKLYGIFPTSELPVAHPACEYLKQRGFDPVTLGIYHGVSYCEDLSYKSAARRIIIPVLFKSTYGTKVIGWQARAIPDHSVTQLPKYLTSPGCMRGSFLYGMHTAEQYPSPVIVEGPITAWRLGFSALASLGRKLTEQQVQLIVSTWGLSEGPIVLWGENPDRAEIRKDWESNYQRVRERVVRPHRVILLWSNDGDAADLSFEEAWSRIDDECAKRNLAPPIRGPGVLSTV